MSVLGQETRVLQLTSSPTFIELPPHPGSNTRSPAFTAVGTMSPFLLGAPGPTAMTVASGRGLFVTEVGRKMPVAVFCDKCASENRQKPSQLGVTTHRLGLEPLDEDTVKQGHESLNGLECCLSSLCLIQHCLRIPVLCTYHFCNRWGRRERRRARAKL